MSANRNNQISTERFGISALALTGMLILISLELVFQIVGVQPSAFVLIIILVVMGLLLVRWRYLLVVTFIISSTVKTALSNFAGLGWVDLTVFTGLLIFLAVIIQLVTDSIAREAFHKHFHILLAFALFLFILFVSAFFLDSTDYGVAKVLRFILLSSMALISPLFLLRSLLDLKKLLWCLMISFVILSALARPNPAWYNRFTIFGADYIVVGRIVGYALLLVLLWKLPTASKWSRVLWILLAFLLTAILMAVNARGPIINILITLLFLLLVTWIFIGRTSTKYVFFVIFVGLLLVPFFPTIIKMMSPNFNFGAIASLVDPISLLESNVRITFYNVVLTSLVNNPTLLGLGAGAFSRFDFSTISGELFLYPHNLFLEVALEQGLIGLLVFCLLLGSTFLTAIRNLVISKILIELSSISLALLGLFTYAFTNSMVSSDLNGSRMMLLSMGMIFWFSVSLPKIIVTHFTQENAK